MTSEGNKDVAAETMSVEQSLTSGVKRKRGRPRKYEYPTYELPHMAQPIQSAPPLYSSQGGSNIQQDGLQAKNTSGKDDILGKHFVGTMTNKFPGFCLITVKVNDNKMLKGWVPDLNNLSPITPGADITTELPMPRPSQVQKQASAIPMQPAPPVQIHLEDVTLAKPLQMRRPVDNTIDKHAIPLATRPYMGSGAAAVPMSVPPSNVEMGTLVKQDKCVVSQSAVAAIPIRSVRPVLVSGKQMANQHELVGEKSFNDSVKDSEYSNGAEVSSVKAEKLNVGLVDLVVNDSPGIKEPLNVQVTDEVGESSGQNEQVNTSANDEIKISLGISDQPNSASGQQSSMEPSDIAAKSSQVKTETVVLKEADDSRSGASDDIRSGSARDEHEIKVDSK